MLRSNFTVSVDCGYHRKNTVGTVQYLQYSKDDIPTVSTVQVPCTCLPGRNTKLKVAAMFTSLTTTSIYPFQNILQYEDFFLEHFSVPRTRLISSLRVFKPLATQKLSSPGVRGSQTPCPTESFLLHGYSQRTARNEKKKSH